MLWWKIRNCEFVSGRHNELLTVVNVSELDLNIFVGGKWLAGDGKVYIWLGLGIFRLIWNIEAV